MFPIIPTAAAVLACIVGLDMALRGEGPPLSFWALSFLAVIPIGELCLLWNRLGIKRRLKKHRDKGFDAGLAAAVLMALLPPLSYGAAMLVFGLPQVVLLLGIEEWVLVDEALLFIPYLAASSLGRFYRHRLASLIDGERRWTRGRTELILGLRGEGAVLIPFFVFVLLGDLLSLSETIEAAIAGTPSLFYGLICIAFAATLLFFPLLLKIVWGLKPIDNASALRAELSGFMREAGFRARDLLLWNTGRTMVNAAILGFLPRWRYILFTDSMLERFGPDDLKGVLAHEIGHGKHGHTLFFILATAAYLACLTILELCLEPFAGSDEEILAVLFFYVPSIALYWWGVFGFLSRRFETEADVYAAQLVNSPALFIGTLERLGLLNRTTRRRASWRHFSIDRRIETLRRFFPEPPVEEGESPAALLRFVRRMALLKILLFALSLLSFAVLALKLLSGGTAL